MLVRWLSSQDNRFVGGGATTSATLDFILLFKVHMVSTIRFGLDELSMFYVKDGFRW